MKEYPLLTLFLVTYNHEYTIRDTFDGILKQKTKYPFVVKVLEDCSTDGTLSICKEYAAKYPQVFTLINQPTNTKCEHYRWGLENEIQTPYWCTIEGDDYYINPLFFQKAISFLESNKEYNQYCGNVIWKYSDCEKINVESCDCEKIGHNITLNNYIYLHTSARMYRNIFDFKLYDRNIYDIAWEILLYFLYLERGKTYFEHEIMSIYRWSGKGQWSSKSKYEIDCKNAEFYFMANDFFGGKYARIFIRFLPRKHWVRIVGKKLFGSKIAMKLLKDIYCKNPEKVIPK